MNGWRNNVDCVDDDQPAAHPSPTHHSLLPHSPLPSIVDAARAWIGTPYRHQASLRGVGCDCLGLLRGVWREVMGAEPEMPPPYSRRLGGGGRRYAAWRGAASSRRDRAAARSPAATCCCSAGAIIAPPSTAPSQPRPTPWCMRMTALASPKWRSDPGGAAISPTRSAFLKSRS